VHFMLLSPYHFWFMSYGQAPDRWEDVDTNGRTQNRTPTASTCAVHSTANHLQLRHLLIVIIYARRMQHVHRAHYVICYKHTHITVST